MAQEEIRQSPWRSALNIGLIGAVAVVLLSLIGMVEVFNKRDIIYKVLSMGQLLLLSAILFMAYMAAKKSDEGMPGQTIGLACIAGVVTTCGLALLIILGKSFNMRDILINSSPVLYMILTFYQGPKLGIPLVLLTGLVSGIAAALIYLAPAYVRRSLVGALVTVAVAGVLQDTLRPVISLWGPIAKINIFLFAANGLSVKGAVSLFILMLAVLGTWNLKGDNIKSRMASLPAGQQRGIKIGGPCLSCTGCCWPSCC